MYCTCSFSQQTQEVAVIMENIGISLAQGLLREEVWYLEGVVVGWPTNDQNVTVRADGQTGTTETVRVDGQTRICRRRTGM